MPDSTRRVIDIPPHEKGPAVLRLHFPNDTWRKLCKAAGKAGVPVKEWAERVLIGAADG